MNSHYQNMQVMGVDPTRDNPYDYYPTPLYFVTSALQIIQQTCTTPERILDPGAGAGVWGIGARQLWPGAFIHGIEMRQDARKPSAYDLWTHADFREWETDIVYDLVIGNPPYGVCAGERDRSLAERFVRKSLTSVRDGGVVFFLLKSVFTEGQERGYGLFREMPPLAIYQSVRRIPFRPETKGNKTNTVAYSLFLWEKGCKTRTQFYWMDWKRGELTLI